MFLRQPQPFLATFCQAVVDGCGSIRTIGVASLEGGVAHVPVQGDVVIDEAVMVMGLCTLR